MILRRPATTLSIALTIHQDTNVPFFVIIK